MFFPPIFCFSFSQGLGLYAARDIEKHTMVIEYIGTIIRNEVANRKEKLYESQVRASPSLSLCRQKAGNGAKLHCPVRFSCEQKPHLVILFFF